MRTATTAAGSALATARSTTRRAAFAKVRPRAISKCRPTSSWTTPRFESAEAYTMSGQAPQKSRFYSNALVKWIEYRLPIFSFIDHSVGSQLYAPRILSHWWNFGSIAGLVLAILIASGLFLAMHYTPQADLAFDSVERIMRDVNYGWLLRYMHMNGASMFFLVVY